MRSLLVCTLVCAACSNGAGRFDYESVSAVPAGEDRVLTILHLLEAGRQQVDRHLAETGEEGAAVRAMMERAERAVVRVYLRARFHGTSHTTESGSGALVAGGRYVVTAGHVVATLREDKAAQVSVMLVDGTVRKARAAEWDYELYGGASRDWAVLELVDALPAGFPSLELASPRKGATVVALGYPAHVGIAKNGRLVYEEEESGLALQPLAMIGRVVDADAVGIAPVVGCVPEGGMSGGPLLDGAGRLVAILTAVSRTKDGDGVRFTVDAAPLESVAKRLRAG